MKTRTFAFTAFALAMSLATGSASFHLMQIEQVFGGINGNTNAQAIQLRMKQGSQQFVSQGSLWVADAAGLNRILLLNIAGDVANSAQGARILLTTAAFNATMVAGGSTGFTGDFQLTNSIPASYLTAGKLTFEADGGTVSTQGTVWWALAWGGAAYTGTNTGVSGTGSIANDADGFFGDNLGHAGPFGSALPSASRQSVLFTGASTADSTNNLANYALSSNPATVTKNNGTAFTVVPEPNAIAFLALGAAALGGFATMRRRR